MKPLIDIAKHDGRIAGVGDAAAYNRDPENFEPLQGNPFGLSSQPKEYEAWERAYENAFEAGKNP